MEFPDPVTYCLLCAGLAGDKDTSAKGEKISDGTCDLCSFLGNSVRAAFAFAMLTRRDNRIEPGVEKLRVNEEIYKNIFQAVSDTDKKIVPLEEALLINEPGVRRELIMDVLNDDPEEYMDLLNRPA